MKTFVINLERAPERKDYISDHRSEEIWRNQKEYAVFQDIKCLLVRVEKKSALSNGRICS